MDHPLTEAVPSAAASRLARLQAARPRLDAAAQNPFEATAAELLAMLRDRLPFGAWVVARLKREDWVAAAVDGAAFGLRAGDVHPWKETLCSKLTAHGDPHDVPDVRCASGWASAPLAASLAIGAYLGIALRAPDGHVIGSLCAVDEAPREALPEVDLRMVQTCARVIARAMHVEICAARLARRLERAESVAFCDALTDLYNRRGWDHLLKAEESRCRRHGRLACVVSIDLDELKAVNDAQGHEAGDEFLRRAARALRTTLRAQDVAARVGGDEFAVLAVECDGDALIALRDRLAAGLAAEGISASVGVAMRTTDLAQAWREADEAMYRAKRSRKAARDA